MKTWRYALPAGVLFASLLVVAAWATVGSVASVAAGKQAERAARSSSRIGSALFLAVARAGERLVAVGERGFVQLSDDGGRSWRQAQQVPVSVTLTNVQFVSASVGWAVGHGGVVLHSRDGGEHWSRQLDGSQAAALALEEAWAGREAGDEAGDEAAQRAVREAEGLVADGADKPLLGLYFRDERRGWVVGAYGLALATEDGGQRWHAVMRRVDNRGGKHLYDIRADGEALVVVGEQGALLRSDDGGMRFAAIESPYAGTWFGAIAGPEDTLVVFGLRGNVYRRQGVAAWQQVDVGQAVTLTAGLRLDDGSLVLADETGRLLRSTDGGAHFTALAATESRSLTSLAQAADGALIVAGTRGMSRIEPELIAKEAK